MKHAIPQRYAIPHRYATRPGLYFTEDGGADVIVRSETADQVWLCIYEKVDQPTAFFNDAIRIFDDSATPFINEIHEHAVCTRIIEPMYVRETLFRMDGPNYGLWYVHLPKAWDGMRYASEWTARGIRARGCGSTRTSCCSTRMARGSTAA